jgi:DNA polymerase-3 subunit delta
LLERRALRVFTEPVRGDDDKLAHGGIMLAPRADTLGQRRRTSMPPKSPLESQVVLLPGKEPYLQLKKLEELIVAGTGGEPSAREDFIAGESAFDSWVSSARTAPFLSDRRVVIVRNLLRSGDVAEFAPNAKSELSGLPESALMILVADAESTDENKKRRLDKIYRDWEAAVKGAGQCVVALPSMSEGGQRVLREQLNAAGKSITPRAAALLVEMSAGSLSYALEESEKLAAYVGDETEIREADVRAIVVPAGEWSIFKLVDAVIGGNAAVALSQLRTLLDSASKAEDAAFQQVLPMLSRQLKLIWQARACLDAGCKLGSAPEELRAGFPKKPFLPGEKDFVQNNAMRAARSLDLETIARCMAIVADTDARLKGLLPSASAEDTLQTLVLRLVDAVGV